jgi:hypothetical protein
VPKNNESFVPKRHCTLKFFDLTTGNQPFIGRRMASAMAAQWGRKARCEAAGAGLKLSHEHGEGNRNGHSKTEAAGNP